jgi:Uma2 family endonuclease
MIVPPRILSDDELLAFSEQNSGWHIEREPDGSLSVAPTSLSNAARAYEVARQLGAWDTERRGIVLASDGGMTLPDKAVRAPDAAWISRERWNAVPPAEREKYARVVPEVVVEIVSPSDDVAHQREKTRRYHEFGALYAVMIDPRSRTCEEFGTPPAGLRFDLDAIFDAG